MAKPQSRYEHKEHLVTQRLTSSRNEGSFGTFPKFIKERLRFYQDACEARPDAFIRYEYPKLLDESRVAVAGLLNVPVDSVVLVSNATVGVNTVIKNLRWSPDGRDVILTFSTIYEGCGKVVDYVVDYFEGLVSNKEIGLTYPMDDEDIIRAFRDAVKEVEAEGKRARACIFDVVSSRPGVLFPWQGMIKACRELGVLSVVDGAQGIGMVPLDLRAADPDFFVSNCHKWLHVPRACAVFYVPERNQHLIPSSLATSHGYAPRTAVRTTPLPPSSKSRFVQTFEFVGTMDNAPYLCVKDAIEWRRTVLGGEDKFLAQLWDLNKRGARLVAGRLGTEVMENSAGTLTNCGMSNVALPIWCAPGGERAKETDTVLSAEDAQKALQWMLSTMVEEYNTFMALFFHCGRMWARISAQAYLGDEDYSRGADVLEALCARVAKREF